MNSRDTVYQRTPDDQVHTIIGAAVDITHQKDTEARLREHEDALERADRRKNEFLAMLAHELRSPLAPIRSAAAAMAAAPVDDPVLARSRDIISRQVQHMARLLDDLLDVARLSSGRMSLQMEQVRLADTILAAVEASRPAIDEKHLRLRFRGLESEAAVRGDHVRLTQVFSNLLQNAARYSHEGAIVTLETSADQDEVVVRVRDEGRGIHPDMIDRIFDLFVRSKEAEASDSNGLGIGLALSRSLVEMHLGILSVRSDGPNRGSEFTVRLPLASPRSHSRVQADEVRAAASRSCRVLVADDNADAAESLSMLLRAHGCDVCMVTSGEAAVREAALAKPDVVFLDLGMPGVSGESACRQIRANCGPTLRIVALTGWGQEADRQRCIAAGFDGHLVKPADPDAILALAVPKALDVSSRS